MSKIIISADSACDLDSHIKERYQVNCFPLHIILNDRQYVDGVDISTEEIYDAYRKNRILPRTSAVNPQQFINYFKHWTDQGYEVLHFCLSSEISSSYHNCFLAAQKLEHIYPIDSRSLSTGIGLLVIEAAERAARGVPAAEIQEEINALREKNQVSFVLDTLDFMHAGGRCPGIVALGANLLNIKPCIEMDGSSGRMRLGQKYRGTLNKVLKKYVADKLQGRKDLKDDRIFITHSGIDRDIITLVQETIRESADFKEILVTKAGCTIAAHCGPNTLGILFMTK